jgi:hypothetical protein
MGQSRIYKIQKDKETPNINESNVYIYITDACTKAAKRIVPRQSKSNDSDQMLTLGLVTIISESGQSPLCSFDFDCFILPLELGRVVVGNGHSQML